MQGFHNSESVAHITEKIGPPRDEILSPPLLYVGVPGFAIGTLRLRVRFHFECTFLSADLSQVGQQETDMRYGYSLAWGIQQKLNQMQTC